MVPSVLLHLAAGLVLGGVVDEDDVVVLVVLLQDRVHVVDVPLLGGVVVGGHYDAEGLFGVLGDVVLLFVVVLFFLGEFFVDR